MKKQLLTFIVLYISSVFLTLSFASATETTHQTVSVLPVNSNKIDSITVEPRSKKGAKTAYAYILKITLDTHIKHKPISILRPLDGQLLDLKLSDLNNDGKEEVIVIMKDQSSTATYIHFDIFEFNGKKISLVENFTKISRLYELFNPSSP